MNTNLQEINSQEKRLHRLVNGLDPADLTIKGLSNLLRAYGLRKRSRSWQDYEKAKLLILGNRVVYPWVYSRIINWITTYLNV